MQKSRKHVLTCWRQNKASKGYVASRGRLSLVKALKWGICELVLNMCILGSAPLLERWRTLEMAAHNIERWRALMLQIFDWTCVLDMGEVAASHPTLGSSLLTIGAPSSSTWCALLIGNSTQTCINKSALSHC